MAESRLAAAVDLDLLRSAPLDFRPLHAAGPRGYGTVAARAAQAAAEAEAAAAAQAAAAKAAVEAAAAEAAAARAATSARAASPSTRAPSASTAGRSSAASSATPARPAGRALPLRVDPGSSSQVVTVVAASAGATTARLTAWQRGADGWTPVLGPVTARVGRAGVGRASESTTRTPAGTFTLTEAFGRAGNP
ncbi:MAG: hypothetical protein ACJ71Y_07055, partial [Blastococcus sp.]